MRRARRRWPFLLACLVVFVLGMVGLTRRPLLRSAVDWLDVGRPPKKSDCVMVLGGGLTTRPFVAATLVRLGIARQVLLPRMVRPAVGEEELLPPEDELAREVLVRRGVPREAILVIGQSCAHTEAEAQALGVWLEKTPDARVTIVTDGYHTRRARWIFRSVFGDSAENVSFVSAPWDWFPEDRWWQSEAGLAVIVGEYAKLLFYGLYYGRAGVWIVAVTGLVAVVWCFRCRSIRGRHDGNCGTGNMDGPRGENPR